MKSRLAQLGVLCVSAALATTGCSLIPSSDQATTSTTVQATSTPTTTRAPSTLRFAINPDTDSNRADNTVIGGPDAFAFYDWDGLKGGDMFSRRPDGAGATVFTEDGGVRVTFTPDRGEKAARGFALGIQQVPSAKALAVTAALVRLPADGLAAEKFEIQARVVDKKGKTIGSVAVDAVEDSGLDGVGLFGDTVVIRYDKDEKNPTGSGDIEYLAAIDLPSKRELWVNKPSTKDGGMSVGGSGDCSKSAVLGVFQSSVFDRSPDGDILYGDAAGMTAVDAKTGKPRWVKPNPRCFLGSPMPGGTYPYRVVTYNGESAYDLRGGKALAVNGVSYAIDRQRNLLAVSYVYRGSMSSKPTLIGGGPALQILDLTSGKALFELPGAEGLKHKTLSVLGAMDGKIWIQSGADVSVIEADTGKTAADSASLAALYGKSASGIPLYHGDKWMVLGSDPRRPKTFLWNSSGTFTLADVKRG
ncbi:hypothetical protein GCM10010528_22350 [Gordonia defluvii]|jgi:hypothetical protein|uniref:Uncharacterized protein n=1 Tax=Gordonia defluvii TaxID=283718 RepID=A0ABP6LGU3_9ACTN|nr:hypothetical protein [Gordonia sp. UBA5067]